LAFFEVTDAPGVGGVEAVAQHAREDVLAAAFQLDERLRLFVTTEGRRLSIAGRTAAIAIHDRSRLGERAIAIHRDVEGDDRERLRKVADASKGCDDCDRGEQAPEERALTSIPVLFFL